MGGIKIDLPLGEKLWSGYEVDPATGCWNWTRGKSDSGYGIICEPGPPKRYHSTHRLAWRLSNPDAPEPSQVLHSCDNKACINPAHLHAGTHRENNAEAVERGLILKGSRHGMAKLTEESVREIKSLAANGATQRSIAGRFSISQSIVSEIVTRKKWRHV